MIKSVAVGCIACLTLIWVSGCGSGQDVPTVVYKARFDNSKIDAVEKIVDEVAEQWRLRVIRKDRQQMSRLTRDQHAFFSALYFDSDAVLFLTNVGSADVLTLITSDHGKMPANDLDRLRVEMMSALRARLNIDLKLRENRESNVVLPRRLS